MSGRLTKAKPQAKYDLARVLRLLPDAMVAKGKARVKVKERLKVVLPMTDTEAEDYVLKMVAELSADAFVESREQIWHEDAMADIYGVRNEHGDWYVKLYIDESNEQLQILSCHEPEGVLRRTDGTKIGRPRK